MSNQTFILILSGCIGIFSGIAAVLLKTGVHTIQNFLTEDFYPSYANFMYILYPLIGITTAFLLGKYVLKDFGGHGIPDVLFSISKKSSLLPRVKIFSRVLTSSFTVGFGGSVGLEAPMVMTGSAIGSNVGALMHLNAKKRTLLIGCGAAGAISAIFGAPIGAVIFAIEVILMEISTASFIPLLIASVTGSLTSMLLIGEDSLFNFNLKDSFQATHMPYYLLLGIISGMVSLYFSKMVVATERLMGALGSHWMRITYGGAFLGFMVFLFPPIYGEGYQTLNVLIDGNATEVLEKSLFFSSLGETKTILLFLSAIFLIAEITGGYELFVPLMFVSAISFITKTYFQKHSVYTLQLKAQGKYLPETKDEELLDNISITQVIEKDLLPIHPDAQLTDLIELVKLSKRNIFPVVDSAQVLQGIVTLDDIRHIMFDAEKQKIVRVKQLMHSPPEILFSSENMQSAMEKFERSGAWNLPVVDNNQYLGFVSKAKIFNAYRKKLQRQKED